MIQTASMFFYLISLPGLLIKALLKEKPHVLSSLIQHSCQATGGLCLTDFFLFLAKNDLDLISCFSDQLHTFCMSSQVGMINPVKHSSEETICFSEQPPGTLRSE